MTKKPVGLRRKGSIPGGIGRPLEARQQLTYALVLLVLVIAGGTVGYMSIENWGILDSFYMTIVTLSTVGYGEVYPLSYPGKILSILLIVTGVGAVAYAVGTAGRIMLDERIRVVLGRRVMKSIQKLQNHYIICGFGRMGSVICEELADRNAPFVVVENDQDAIETIERQGYLYIKGDATLDDVLKDAGIDKALGLVSVVAGDTENVFIVLTARGLNPKLNIVVRSATGESIQKLIRAGANKVVSPYYLGGFRIAQALLSPTVIDFLETIVHDKTKELRLEEVLISPKSRLAGANLATSGLRKDLNLIILAIKKATGGMQFNPSYETEIKSGDTLVVMGHTPSLQRLEEIAEGA